MRVSLISFPRLSHIVFEDEVKINSLFKIPANLLQIQYFSEVLIEGANV